ncbi:MAG: A/G-specific adenine glycosylase [Methanoregula sp.]|jgi:A/G-specific adenine glycosylase|uniref:A/G-specific adenine glycosylase n=1 Tax=Methanoregula sp. TaxID=2052170 RepID=UPI0025F228A7|nr:A/G-specific adenine glycosylase [Methanoregula sp.]MCK9630964.1 A/G-specific adenine glycosylase [Methanoregula sp.]
MPARKNKPETKQMHLDGTTPPISFEDSEQGIAAFRQMVLSHYEQSGRHDMPWRHTTDPYHILVSEIMLQQTQVERVTIKYPEFIAAFPDFTALAHAPLADILRVWQGMGYNRRAIALQKCAIRVTEEFRGILPRDVETLATFPGIGHATASSIAAFAFNLPVVFIETNIRRVFIHYFFHDRDAVRDDEILPLVGKALYLDDPRVWYWALMDLGTLLKKSVPNPNRKSVHYTKQSAFEGSDRRIRGQVLKLLLSRGGTAPAAIVRELGEEKSRVLRILAELEDEGFIRKTGTKIMLVS